MAAVAGIGDNRGMSCRFEVTEEQWNWMEPILRPVRRPDGKGRPPADTRRMLNGVLWILGTGAQWRELPPEYGPFQTVHGRFQRWVREGKLEQVLRRLSEELYAQGKLKLAEAFIDATFAPAKKGGLRSAPPSAAKARKSWPSPTSTVSPWPSPSNRPRRTKAVS
jgi:transposase